MEETWIQFLDWEDPAGGGHGNPLQYFCLENPHGQRSLAGYSPWGHKELDTTEQLNMKLPEISLASLMTPLLQTPVTSTNLSHVIKD